jgi:3-phenylpropionate/cinnamic acid dioxygenase small subunit
VHRRIPADALSGCAALGQDVGSMPPVNEPTTSDLASELEIRNVLARLAHYADSGEVDEYLALLTDDVTWAMPPNPAIGLAASERRGHDEIAAGQRERVAAGVQGPGSDTMHVITTSAVEVEGDRARAYSYFQYFTSTATEPTVTNVGRYRDEFRRTERGWQLSRRSVTFG